MRPELCLCCNKTTQFRNAVFTASNIVKYLQEIIENIKYIKDNQYYQMLHLLKNDKQRISFPCGMCYKVNQRELDSLEDEMDELLCIFILKYPDKEKYLHSILRLLAGHYPMKYKTLEQEVKRRKNNNE